MGVPITVSIDSELLAKVDALGGDVTQMLEQAVLRREKEKAALEFYRDNKEFVDSYNAHVAEHGLASKRHGLRRS